MERVDDHDRARERKSDRDRPAAESLEKGRLRAALEADVRDPAWERG
jgi:hypothetical protein